MGKVIDLLEGAVITISNYGSRMLSDEFMMSIFQSLKDDLPEFAEFMDFMFEHKETPTILKNESNLTDFNNSKVLPYDLLRAELFFPAREENQATDTVCTNMAVELAQTMLVELRDPKKATSDYLSSEEGQFSWGQTTQSEHEACIGLMATNNMAESPFAGLTHQFQIYGRILGIHASGISQARINGDFRRILNGMDKKDGMFHCLSPKMKESLLRMAIRDAPTVRANEEVALNKQRKHKQNKQDML